MLEDDPKDAELDRELLEAAHFVCDFILTQTRAEFLSALENDGIDLILADYKLPRSTAFRVAAYSERPP